MTNGMEDLSPPPRGLLQSTNSTSTDFCSVLFVCLFVCLFVSNPNCYCAAWRVTDVVSSSPPFGLEEKLCQVTPFWTVQNNFLLYYCTCNLFGTKVVRQQNDSLYSTIVKWSC